MAKSFGPKHKKPFISASKHARTVLNAFLECMYFDKMTGIYAYMDVPYMDGRRLYIAF